MNFILFCFKAYLITLLCYFFNAILLTLFPTQNLSNYTLKELFKYKLKNQFILGIIPLLNMACLLIYLFNFIDMILDTGDSAYSKENFLLTNTYKLNKRAKINKLQKLKENGLIIKSENEELEKMKRN